MNWVCFASFWFSVSLGLRLLPRRAGTSLCSAGVVIGFVFSVSWGVCGGARATLPDSVSCAGVVIGFVFSVSLGLGFVGVEIALSLCSAGVGIGFVFSFSLGD